jgi:hypothetical protein
MLQDYNHTITASVSASDAYRKVSRVSEWWNQRATGSSQKVGDAFRVDFGETWVDFKVVEAVEDRRYVWLVTDCHLHWLKDKTEWKGTRVVWNLTPENGTTTVTITHVGLTPAAECFTNCEAGWNFYVGESLLQLLKDDRGLPDRRGKASA